MALILLLCLGCLFLDGLAPRSSAQCSPDPQWKQIGPSPLAGISDDLQDDSGLVRDIAIDPRGTSDQTIYIATDNGGIWKTTDAGATWAPKTDFMPSLNMGAVALDPGNPSIVYAGTGNFQTAGFQNGVGIYKSKDGGDNWTVAPGNYFLTNFPAGDSTCINRIVLPAPGVLLVATITREPGNYIWGGVYKSVDGGDHVGNNVPNFDNGNPVLAGAIWQVAVDTADPSVVYASSTEVGIYKSSDQGTTFPDNLFSSGNGAFKANDGSTTTVGYIAFAQSTQPDNQTIYANVSLRSGGPPMTNSDGTVHPGSSAMLKSSNRGATWTYVTLNGDIRPSYQDGYDLTIGVDPQDKNRVYLGMRALFMATDGGAAGLGNANRIDLHKVHADQHALVFSPPSHRAGRPTRFYNGTDGGIATNPDGGVNHWTLLNGSTSCTGPNTALATILFRQIDIGRGSTLANEYTYGASQDNGQSFRQLNCPGTPWHYSGGGDGNTVAVDPRDPTHAIGDDDGGFMEAKAGGEFGSPDSGLPAAVAQLYFDPNGGTAYALLGWDSNHPNHQNEIYRRGANATSFSLMHAFTPATSALTTINMVALDSNTIWVGLDDGRVWHTSGANQGTAAAWKSSLAPGMAGTSVSGIAIDPANTAGAVVVFSSGQAFQTTDNGTTWKDISANLPGLPIHAVVIDPNTSPHSIIVATDTGVMRTAHVGDTWETLGWGLPTVQCTSLAMDFERHSFAFARRDLRPQRLRTGLRPEIRELVDRAHSDWHARVSFRGTHAGPERSRDRRLEIPHSRDGDLSPIPHHHHAMLHPDRSRRPGHHPVSVEFDQVAQRSADASSARPRRQETRGRGVRAPMPRRFAQRAEQLR